MLDIFNGFLFIILLLAVLLLILTGYAVIRLIDYVIELVINSYNTENENKK
jgi:hypothetical protein